MISVNVLSQINPLFFRMSTGATWPKQDGRDTRGREYGCIRPVGHTSNRQGWASRVAAAFCTACTMGNREVFPVGFAPESDES
jgi:hypothetical protein